MAANYESGVVVAAEVVAGEPNACWSVSYTTGGQNGGATLNVRRVRTSLPFPRSLAQRGDNDGRWFPSYDEAQQFALDHGYTRRYFTSADLRARRVADGAAREKAQRAARAYVAEKYGAAA